MFSERPRQPSGAHSRRRPRSGFAGRPVRATGHERAPFPARRGPIRKRAEPTTESDRIEVHRARAAAKARVPQARRGTRAEVEIRDRAAQPNAPTETPARGSHIRTRSSVPPDASSRPSRLKASASIHSEPRRVCRSTFSLEVPDRISPSSLPDASRRPSRVKARLVTTLTWPASVACRRRRAPARHPDT